MGAADHNRFTMNAHRGASMEFSYSTFHNDVDPLNLGHMSTDPNEGSLANWERMWIDIGGEG
jgi:hypothetical protein